MSSSTVVFITKDLFFIPMLKQATERAGYTLAVSPSVGNSRLEHVTPSEVVVCVVDLTAIGTDEIAQVALQLKARFSSATLAAFGPHVHEQQLRTAAESGFDHVLTRGQLSKNADHWIAVWTAKPQAST